MRRESNELIRFSENLVTMRENLTDLLNSDSITSTEQAAVNSAMMKVFRNLREKVEATPL